MKHKILYGKDNDLYGVYCPKDSSFFRWKAKPNFCSMCGKNLKSLKCEK